MNTEVVQEEERTEHNQQHRAYRSSYLEVTRSQPLLDRQADELASCCLVRVDHHVKIERGCSQAEDRIKRTFDAIAQRDQRAENQHLDHRFHELPVVDRSYPGDKAEKQGQAGI